MIGQVVSDVWHALAGLGAASLATTLIGLGVLPGWVLRLVVLAYPKGHPRRSELVSELYEVPFKERPLWVAEKFEIALSEGLPERRRRRTKQRGHVQSVRVVGDVAHLLFIRRRFSRYNAAEFVEFVLMEQFNMSRAEAASVFHHAAVFQSGRRFEIRLRRDLPPSG